MNTASLFQGIQILSIAILFFLFLYTKSQKPSQMQRYASTLAFSTMLMLFGYLLEMKASTLEGAYYGLIIGYMGSPFLLVSAFLLVCTFYGKKVPKWLFFLMMFVGLSITAVVATNPYHHLFYTDIRYNADAVFSPLVLTHGPLYFLNLGTVIFYNAATAVIVFTGYRQSMSPLKRRLSVYSLLMMLCAMSGFILYFLNVADGYDTTMFGLTAASLCLCALFFRCRIFDVIDSAKDYALEMSSEGLQVYDDTGKLVYQNHTASRVVGDMIPDSFIRALRDEKALYKEQDEVFSVSAASIQHSNDYLGKSVEIHNITQTYRHQEQLEAAVAAATSQLESVQRTILGSFANLVEARNLETGDHIKRVSRYTQQIANAMRAAGKYPSLLSEDYIRTLTESAPLHDVGKISISDVILLKPGKLTQEEFSEMKKHAEMGAKVIRSTMEGLESEHYVAMAEEIALYHHERWDGTGYPAGLRGEEIPLSARIVAVADCYDAMTSKRCYKDAFPKEKALASLSEESGTHFDPQVVEAFLSGMAET